MSREKLAIEKLLPDLFIYQLGAYLQTCAHIELASCALITCLEHDFKADPKIWMHHYSSTRKLNTKDLIKRLRASVEKAEEHGFADALETLAAWIERFVGNRHMAAHGAFFGSPHGYLRVDYVTNSGSRKNPNFVQNRAPITPEIIKEVVKDADDIFLTLIDMIEEIDIGLTTKIMCVIVPIVEHPEY